jgi:hypothetical protein
MSIDVQVERPVTIKVNGETIKLTNEEARELARKLNDALGISLTPGLWPHPVYYKDSSGNDWMYYTSGTTPTPTIYGNTISSSITIEV